MYALALVLLAASPAQPPTTKHEDQNPLYKNLIDPGVEVGGAKVKLPKPTMPDGLTAAQQTAIIKELAGDQFNNFLRQSPVAPQILKIRDIAGGNPNAPVQGVDVWFVAYGDFKRLEDEKFLDKLTNTNKAGGKSGPLTKADLGKRNIVLKAEDEKREGYGHFEFDFLEKVRLSGAGHAMWSRNPESVVASAEIDPRFLNDKDFPNQWRSIKKEDGEVKVGAPNPWSGAAMYFKITKLAAPEGALFIEQHVIFTEPTGWFDGANLLRSKLPIAVQSNVRSMRAEFLKK